MRVDASRVDLIEQPTLVARSANVGWKEVDRDSEILERPFPDGGRTQGLVLDEPRQAFAERGGFGPGEERLGIGGDGGTRERFRTDDAAGGDIDDRLEE